MDLHHRFASFVLVTITGASCLHCSSDKSPNGVNGSGGSGNDAGAPSMEQDAAPPAPEPFNGDCSTARWGHVTDACWTCMCDACKDKLDVCNEGCIGILECAEEKHALVNVSTDLSCEVTATTVNCLSDPKAQMGAQALVNFDACLMSAQTKKSGEFRACDQACKRNYTGDVCTRYPPAM